MEALEEMAAVASGWHRTFRMRMRTHRGTLDRPGSMMGLDRGGRCRGVALRLAEEGLASELDKLVRREMPVRPASAPPHYAARWIRVGTDRGPLLALAFVMERKGASYVGGLTQEETADILATACGHGGSCAEYLRNTIAHLEARGIRDRNLWRLQSLVAARLASMVAP